MSEQELKKLDAEYLAAKRRGDEKKAREIDAKMREVLPWWELEN